MFSCRFLRSCFSELKQPSLDHGFLCFICVRKYTETEVRLSTALDCSSPYAFSSSDPRFSTQDLLMLTKKETTGYQQKTKTWFFQYLAWWTNNFIRVVYSTSDWKNNWITKKLTLLSTILTKAMSLEFSPNCRAQRMGLLFRSIVRCFYYLSKVLH